MINSKIMLAIINYVVLPCVLLRKSLRQKNHGINGLIRTVRQAIVYCLWNGVCRWPVSFYFFFVYYPCLSSEVLYIIYALFIFHYLLLHWHFVLFWLLLSIYWSTFCILMCCRPRAAKKPGAFRHWSWEQWTSSSLWFV